jgi:hypothetical protein
MALLELFLILVAKLAAWDSYYVAKNEVNCFFQFLAICVYFFTD